MESKIVTLRPLIEADLPSYFNWINNRELVLYNSNYKPISMLDHLKWFEAVSLQKDISTFSIIENQNNHLIGTCSLRNISLIHKNAELQIRIGEIEYQNKGLGREAINLLIQYAFNDLNLSRVFLHVFSDNLRAVKTYEHCGFEIEGLMRNAAYIDGEYKNINIMAVLKNTPDF
jgi:RimJ/RimL family protein N-acetyltransferase